MSCEYSRREFLKVAAGLVVVGAAGCQKENISTDSTANAVTVAPMPTATKNADGTLSVPGGGKLAKGEGVVFNNPDGAPGIVFVTQKGELRGLSASCTHSGCTLNWEEKGGENGQSRLHCPCHASNFDTTGKVLNGPATLPLKSFRVLKKGDDAIVTT